MSPSLPNSWLLRARPFAVLLAALFSTSLLLTVFRINPFDVFAAMISDSLGSKFGLTEAAVRSIPILLCALATALPAWTGLVNIGNEGQFYLGAIGGTAAVLLLPDLAAPILIPLMLITAFIAGAIWAGAGGLLKAYMGVNETLVSLLLNFVAIFLLNYLVHGPWRDPQSYNWPYSREFPDAALLPNFGGSRIHAGLIIALAALIILTIWKNATVWGFRARVVKGNPDAAMIANISVRRFMFWTMAVAGGLAALAGACEVSAIQGRLRPEISPGYGYNGFLVAWLSKHNPAYIVPISFLVGCLMTGGDSLQIKLNLPFATVNIILSLLLLSTLAIENFIRGTRD